jgi:hypothetical protein
LTHPLAGQSCRPARNRRARVRKRPPQPRTPRTRGSKSGMTKRFTKADFAPPSTTCRRCSPLNTSRSAGKRAYCRRKLHSDGPVRRVLLAISGAAPTPSGSDLQDVNPLRVFDGLCRFTPILIDLPRTQTANSRLDVVNANRAVANIMQHLKEGRPRDPEPSFQSVAREKPGVNLEPRAIAAACPRIFRVGSRTL